MDVRLSEKSKRKLLNKTVRYVLNSVELWQICFAAVHALGKPWKAVALTWRQQKQVCTVQLLHGASTYIRKILQMRSGVPHYDDEVRVTR